MDSFEVIDVLQGAAHTAVAFRFTSGDQALDGVDLMTLNEAGLVASLKLVWRPLPALLALQNRIAPGVGAPVLTLLAAPPAAA